MDKYFKAGPRRKLSFFSSAGEWKFNRDHSKGSWNTSSNLWHVFAKLLLLFLSRKENRCKRHSRFSWVICIAPQSVPKKTVSWPWGVTAVLKGGLRFSRRLLHIYGCGVVVIFGKQLVQKLWTEKGKERHMHETLVLFLQGMYTSSTWPPWNASLKGISSLLDSSEVLGRMRAGCSCANLSGLEGWALQAEVWICSVQQF